MLKQALFLLLSTVLLYSCVSSKKYKAQQVRYEDLNKEYARLQSDLKNCEDFSARQKANMQTELDALKKENAFLKENNSNVLNQLKDVNIQVEKGVVFINISDKLLFKSGSSVVSDEALSVLGKVARVLNANPSLDILIEGHTDSVPIKNACIVDNWDLSVKRATSVTRILQNSFSIDPVRMTAGGRGEYLPLVSNDSKEGRASNRRTRIIILPQLDQFFKLLEKKA